MSIKGMKEHLNKYFPYYVLGIIGPVLAFNAVVNPLNLYSGLYHKPSPALVLYKTETSPRIAHTLTNTPNLDLIMSKINDPQTFVYNPKKGLTLNEIHSTQQRIISMLKQEISNQTVNAQNLEQKSQ